MIIYFIQDPVLDAAGDVKVYRVGQEGSVWYEGNAKKGLAW